VSLDFLALQSALAGQYFLEREVGRGGMGVVYLARELRLDRPVAIKVLPPELAARPELRERFVREARTAANLSHPHIVPIFRVDDVGGFVFIVMAYVDGGTVGDRMRARGTLPAAEVARLMREVGWALAYAHARGVVHRDIKPDNILLDGHGRAIVTDFGIAQHNDAISITGEGHVMGTAHYMSPEQAAGEPLDGRSDLYSLAVVAYQALAGRPLFDAPTVPALLAMHLTRDPTPLTGVPMRLARVVMSCLAKEPPSRPPTGEAMAEMLAEADAQERVLPAPLRAWAEARDPLVPLYAFWSGASILAAVIKLQMSKLFAATQHPLEFVAPQLAAALLPLVPIAIFELRQAHRALGCGYSIADLRVALLRHQAFRREEMAADVPILRPWLARLLRTATYGTIALLVGMLVTIPALEPATRERIPQAMQLTVFVVAAVLGVSGSALGLTFPGRPADRGLFDRLRARFWSSGTGEAVARLLVRNTAPAPAAQHVHRPTELAIGLAADALYDALPAPTRLELRELPPIVRKLEREAETLRERVDHLDARLQELDGSGATSLADRRREVGDTLRRAREEAAQRRDTTVTALESIRLELLRLQAGIPAAESITNVLETARRLGQDVDRLVVARDDASAHAALRSPTR
jgi:serine/threonine-protein kinase